MNNNTRKRSGKDFSCFICGAITYKSPSEIKKCKDGNPTCSKKCMRKKQSVVRQSSIEKRLGTESLEVWLKDRYLNKQMSTTELAKAMYGKGHYSPNVLEWMRKFGIPSRSRSDSVVLQWHNNDERRESQANHARLKMGANSDARKRLIKVMQTDEYRVKTSTAKLGENNPMYGVTGKQHPKWNPNRTKDQRIEERKTGIDRNWRISVIIRDGRKCVVCGYDGRDIVVHHLNSYHWDVENRYNIDNGVVLCGSCHKDFHAKYGYMNNTKKEFAEYMKTHSKINNKQLSIL